MFKDEIRDRYLELRKDILTVDNIYKEIDEFYSLIPSSTFDKESKRWGDIPGYDIEQMKDFINKRLIYLDGVYS